MSSSESINSTASARESVGKHRVEIGFGKKLQIVFFEQSGKLVKVKRLIDFRQIVVKNVARFNFESLSDSFSKRLDKFPLHPNFPRENSKTQPTFQLFPDRL